MILDKQFKYKGFYYFQRELINDLFNKKITFDQFALLAIYIGLADWENRHKDFAICKLSNNTLGDRVVGLNKNKISFNKRILWIKNYIEIIHMPGNNEFVKIINPEQYFNKKNMPKSDSISPKQDRFKV